MLWTHFADFVVIYFITFCAAFRQFRVRFALRFAISACLHVVFFSLIVALLHVVFLLIVARQDIFFRLMIAWLHVVFFSLIVALLHVIFVDCCVLRRRFLIDGCAVTRRFFH